MKLLIASLAMVFSLSIGAETIKLGEYPYSHWIEVYHTIFRVNKDLNRAWVEVTLAETVGDSTFYEDHNVKVEGLAYSPELNGVVFNRNGEEIVCGTFYNRRWTIDRGMSFLPTGRCELSHKTVTKNVDDGFYVRKVKVFQVFLTIN